MWRSTPPITLLLLAFYDKLWRWCILAVAASPSSSPSSFFQRPPHPLGFWPPLPPLPPNFTRPIAWEDKDFGQWCRNFTADVHTQCPEATPFHWYVCCGAHNAECCFGIQTWCYVIFGVLLLSAMSVAVFALLLQLNLVCRVPKNRRHKAPSPTSLISGTTASVLSDPLTTGSSGGGEAVDHKRGAPSHSPLQDLPSIQETILTP